MKLESDMRINKKRTRILLIILLVVISSLALLYPTISTAWNNYRSSLLITNFRETLDAITDDDHTALIKAARDYNEAHTWNTITDAFEDDEPELYDTYLQMLDPLANGMMGYIDIPKIGQKLIIYHGTGAAVLEQGVGHLEGTSLPIGGSGSHCVLAAHRGLPGIRLFTDLDRMEVGDKFFLHVSRETLEYEVDSIVVASPYDTDLLRIEQGRDLVTLLTCTPYGVNTQRLLVRGSRIPYHEDDIKAEQKKHVTLSTMDISAKAWCGEMLVLLLMFIVYCLRKLIHKHRKRGEKKDDGKTADSTS